MAAADRTDLHEERVEYVAGGTRLIGHLTAPTGRGQLATSGGRRPGVLVFPEWWGTTDFPRDRARDLARRGYVTLVADVYGEGRTTSSAEEAAQLSADTRVGPLSRERSRAALTRLTEHPEVDPERVAAIGFCFGGDVGLELARDGAALRGVVAFHAALASGEPAQRDRFHPAVLVLHGAEDPLTPPERVTAFTDEMRAAGADWQLITYGGAVHSFTNPTADEAQVDGVAYHAAAARRSWAHQLVFLDEVLA